MIYIDEVLLLNFIIDYLILLLTKKILKLNTKNYRLILASLFAELSIFCLFFNNKILLIMLKIIIIYITNIISFGYIDIKSSIKNTIYTIFNIIR